MCKIDVSFRGHRPGDDSFPGAGRSVQEDPLGRLNAKPVENLGKSQGKLDHLPDALDLRAEAADVLV